MHHPEATETRKTSAAQKTITGTQQKIRGTDNTQPAIMGNDELLQTPLVKISWVNADTTLLMEQRHAILLATINQVKVEIAQCRTQLDAAECQSAI